MMTGIYGLICAVVGGLYVHLWWHRSTLRHFREYLNAVNAEVAAKDAHLTWLRGQLADSKAMTRAALTGDTVEFMQLTAKAIAACAEDVKP